MNITTKSEKNVLHNGPKYSFVETESQMEYNWVKTRKLKLK